MPILGLFKTGQEQYLSQQNDDIATGRKTSGAVNDIARQTELARQAAYSNAYLSRGNPALAQRQADTAALGVAEQGSAQMASQRSSDVAAAEAQQRVEAAEQAAGINNLIGMGAQAVGTMYGGPAGGAAAGAGAKMLTSSVNPSEVSPKDTAALSKPIGQQSAQPGQSAMGQLDGALNTYDHRDDEMPLQGSFGDLLSDERMKEEARNGNPAASNFLDQLSASMADLRRTLPQDLQANADKAISQVQADSRSFTPMNTSGQARHVFDTVKPQTFNYSEEGQAAGGAPGPQLGVMAQDVEQVAPQMVNQDAQGNRRIDVNQALSASLAAQADLNERLHRLEGDPLEGIDSDTADPLDNLRDTAAPDLYSRPGNQRDPAADRPRRQPSAEDERYGRNHRFLQALSRRFKRGESPGFDRYGDAGSSLLRSR